MKCATLFFCLLFINSNLSATSQEEEYLIQQAVSQGYDEHFIDLVELIYGKGFLSQGGAQAVERMVKGSILDNRTILDIGSGLGGPTLYLAEQSPVTIIGLEPQKWLHERAIQNLKTNQEPLKGSIRFILMQHPSRLEQFADESFDIILSKEAILHIPLPCKRSFFAEIHRVLKPGGELIIMD